MAPLVLAGAEPAAGGDVPNPEYDRHGGALLAESPEQGTGDRLSVRPRDRRVAPGRLGALARVGSGEHGASLRRSVASLAARVQPLRDTRPVQTDRGGGHPAPAATRPAGPHSGTTV